MTLTITFRVVLQHEGQVHTLELTQPATATVADVLSQLLVEAGVLLGPGNCVVLCGLNVIRPEQTLAEIFAGVSGVPALYVLALPAGKAEGSAPPPLAPRLDLPPLPVPPPGAGVDMSGAPSEFELTLDGAPDAEARGEAAERDTFQTEFEIPALDEESGSEAIALDEADTDLGDSDFECALEEDEADEDYDEEEEYEEEACEVSATVVRARRVVREEAEEEEESLRGPAKAKHSAAGAAKPRTGTRRATVRYYSRMNPERVFPLLVTLTKQMVEAVVQKHVAQKASGPISVNLDQYVEIEPVLPGCTCYPAKAEIKLGSADAALNFWVVPHVLGKVKGAAVYVRQDGRTLAEIPLDVKVARQTLTVVAGCFMLALPLLSSLAKRYGLDFESQMADGFNLYFAVMHAAVKWTSPAVLAGLLGLVTFGLYLARRPKQRDVFHDVTTVGPEQQLARARDALLAGEVAKAGALMVELLKAYPKFQRGWLFYAAWHYDEGNHADALKCYEKALAIGVLAANEYTRAASAAARLENHGRAYEILKSAEAKLPESAVTGTMWYNMGCYACRSGRPDEAMHYLGRALQAGYRKAEQFRKDPDLDPLRKRPDFRQLLAAL